MDRSGSTRHMSPDSISSVVRAAGQVEAARHALQHEPEYRNVRSHLKTIVDALLADAVSGKVNIANNIERNFGRED